MPFYFLLFTSVVFCFPTLVPNSTLRVKQAEDWAYFQIGEQANGPLAWFVTVEALTSSAQPLVLMGKCATPPQATNHTFDADFIDTLGWLSLAPQLLLSIGVSPCAHSTIVGVFSANSSADYSIVLQSTTACVHDCYGAGHCVQAKCECESGYSGVDCRTATPSVTPGEETLLKVPAEGWRVAYVAVAGRKEVMVEWSASNNTVDVCLVASETSNLEWGGTPQCDYWQEGGTLSKAGKATLTELEPQSRLFVLLHNTGTSECIVTLSTSISVGSSGSSSVVIISITVMAGLLLVCFVACFVLVSYRAYQRKKTIVSAVTVKEVPSTRRQALTVTKGVETPTNELNSICFICLDMFTPKSATTVLPCSHAFHSTCIEKWLEFNSSCCACHSLLQSEAGSPGLDPYPTLETSQNELI